MVLGLKLEAWLTIAAILLGPLMALLVQQWRDERREYRKRKHQLFQQLILTLKVPLAPRHVDALNSIPLEFYSVPIVMQAWREYVSHLGNHGLRNANPQGWAEKKSDFLVALAFEMGKSLGYAHIDKATLRDNLYVPQGYDDSEAQNQQLRTALLRVLKGEHPISTTMVGPIQVVDPLPSPTNTGGAALSGGTSARLGEESHRL